MKFNPFEQTFYRLGEAFDVRYMQVAMKGEGLKWHIKREETGELLYNEAPTVVEFDLTLEALEEAEEKFLNSVVINKESRTFTAKFDAWGRLACRGCIVDDLDHSKLKYYKGKFGRFLGYKEDSL